MSSSSVKKESVNEPLLIKEEEKEDGIYTKISKIAFPAVVI